MSKKVERICKNCILYNPKERVCGVTVLQEGEELELMTRPDDKCHWERVGLEINFDMIGEIKEVKVWSDDTQGYIQYPED